MPHAFEQAVLWQQTLASRSGDEHAEDRERLRTAFLRFRAKVEPYAAEIASSMPMFTEHGISHADALWEMAGLVCGSSVTVNPAESFVLGGAFLLHDLGMGLAVYPGGADGLEEDPNFGDLLIEAKKRLSSAAPALSEEEVTEHARTEIFAQLLRQRHAERAQELITTKFHTSSGDPFFLLEDSELRAFYGPLIGEIAHSHWWPVSRLDELPPKQGAYCMPSAWEVDPVKVACILRLADAAHIDHRRAPMYLHAFRRPTGMSRDHWTFQERLAKPHVDEDRLVYTAPARFGPEEAAAWWLAFETVQRINEEFRQVDSYLADGGRPRFAVRSVAGADSPKRLARYIRTDGWQPIDARLRVTDTVQLIAQIGGREMYGNRPDIALRELIANASDATRARAKALDEPLREVTVTLERDGESWWLEVADHGIGMGPEDMVANLTDFGRSQWRSSSTITRFPGLLAKGFEPTGRFGIGFFAVFMAADVVQVRSFALDGGTRDTHVLEFTNGVAVRPLLRVAKPAERLSEPGTVVRARLLEDPKSIGGLFQAGTARKTHTELLRSEIARLCALSEVDLRVKGPEDLKSVLLIKADDWQTIPAKELFGRLYGGTQRNILWRRSYEEYAKLFAEHETHVLDAEGNLVGRAMMLTGDEAVGTHLSGYHYLLRARIYVGGLESMEFQYATGAFQGVALKADRLSAFPLGPPKNLQDWAASQAQVSLVSPATTEAHRWEIADYVGGFGVVDPALPCAYAQFGPLDVDGLSGWLRGKDEIVLLSIFDFWLADWLWTPDEPGERTVFSNDWRQIVMTDRYLLADLYPRWLFPEEMLARPIDDRFPDSVEEDYGWDVRYWWRSSGNYGPIGIVVRTIAAAWGIDTFDLVNLMEPYGLTAEEDQRFDVPTVDGGYAKAVAIRMRKPEVRNS